MILLIRSVNTLIIYRSGVMKRFNFTIIGKVKQHTLICSVL